MRIRALSLLSGGLDSILAARLLQSLGIEVIGVGFSSPFFSTVAAARSAHALQIEFHQYDLTDSLLKLVKTPRYGWGKNLNPCVDCHALMIKRAFVELTRLGADFIATGEVLGQRRKSQVGAMMKIVAQAAPEGLLLRPLSARLLPPTIPEKNGWVDRSLLLDISGRSRKRQIELAKSWGITDYSTPAGGCLLTDFAYCQRLRELERHEGWNLNDIQLLSLGRHFRLISEAKVVSGRNEQENFRLADLALKNDLLFETSDRQRSLILLRGDNLKQEDIILAARICARYSQGKKEGEDIPISWWPSDRSEKLNHLVVSPLPEKELEIFRL